MFQFVQDDAGVHALEGLVKAQTILNCRELTGGQQPGRIVRVIGTAFQKIDGMVGCRGLVLERLPGRDLQWWIVN